MEKSAIILLGLVVVASGCVDGVDDTPENAVESYFDHVTGFSQDYESAYQLLSDDVQQNTSLEDFRSRMSAEIGSIQGQGGSIEKDELTVINQSEGSTTVEVNYHVDFGPGISDYESAVELVREEEEWRIDEEFYLFD